MGLNNNGVLSHEYSAVFDGHHHSHNALERAIEETLQKFLAKYRGEKEWYAMAIEVLDCNEEKKHSPNLCWHYKVSLIYE